MFRFLDWKIQLIAIVYPQWIYLLCGVNGDDLVSKKIHIVTYDHKNVL